MYSLIERRKDWRPLCKMKHKINKKKLKLLFKNRNIKKLCNYYVEFKTNEKGTEYYNLYEQISFVGQIVVILSLPFLIIYSIIMQGIPDTIDDLKKIGNEINYKRIDRYNTWKIEELKR
jgi:hypothetical protein